MSSREKKVGRLGGWRPQPPDRVEERGAGRRSVDGFAEDVIDEQGVRILVLTRDV